MQLPENNHTTLRNGTKTVHGVVLFYSFVSAKMR